MADSENKAISYKTLSLKSRMVRAIKGNVCCKYFISLIKNLEKKKIERLRKPYIELMSGYIDKDTTMICSNCFAGRVMQDLGMKYSTPTVGLYFWAEDYIEFLTNLDYYLKDAKLEFVELSKNKLGNERRANWEHWYPIGLLGGKVEIHFLHYYSVEEATEKWYRRAKRINWNKLVIFGFEQNLCNDDHIRQFDKLTFTRKFFFSTKDIPDCRSNIYVPEFEEKGEIGDPYKNGHIIYKHLIDYCNQQVAKDSNIC